MPVTDLPPVLNREALKGLRVTIETAVRGSIDECVALRASLSKLAPHLSADPGVPAKKLGVSERAMLRDMVAAKVDADDLDGLIVWLEGEIGLMRNLRRARAA